MGRITPKDDFFITMRDLYTAGLLSKYDGGVKLLSRVRFFISTYIFANKYIM